MLFKLVSWQCYLFSILIATTSAAVTPRHTEKNNEALDPRVENIVEHSVVTDAETTTAIVFNHNFNHIGISVPNIEDAVTFYTDILGLRHLLGPTTTDRATEPNATIFLTYGSELNIVKTAWLAMGNGVGFEVFQFIDPKYEGPTAPTDSFEYLYTRGGMFHLSVTDPDPPSLLTRVVAAGGKQVGEILDLGNGDSAVYMMDPWGNIVECMSITFEMLMSNRG